MRTKLSELATIFYGKDYKKNPAGDNVPIYGTGGIMGYTSDFLQEGPAILSGRKGSINNPLFIKGKFWNVDTIFCIKAHENVDVKWLYYNFCNTDLTILNEATGVPSVNSKSLYNLTFNVPPLSQQKKIAEILTTCDEVIAQTEAAIAKYKAIKQGMMQDLFTRGIDPHTHRLRPTPQQALELYEDSELGLIPKEWEVVESIAVCKFINGRAYHISEWEEYGTPVIRLQNLTGSGETFYYSNLNLPEDQYCHKSDLLYMWSATFGPHIWQKDKAIFHYHIWKVECDAKLLDKKYFYYELERFTQSAIQNSSGSTMSHLTKIGMERRLLAFPSIAEQVKISKVLGEVESSIHSEESALEKYQKVKIGLMHDLLTGKVAIGG